MIELSEIQADALVEIFNIGAGQAAAGLSEIVGDEVKLSVPRIAFYDRNAVTAGVLALAGERLGSVRQTFSGRFRIDAALLFSEDNALEIVREMIGSQVSVDDLVDFEQEAMCELGNIILNACIASIADLLQIELDSTLPHYLVDKSSTIITDLVADHGQPVVLVLHIDLTIERRETNGCLVFLLSSSSLHELLAAIDRFIERI